MSEEIINPEETAAVIEEAPKSSEADSTEKKTEATDAVSTTGAAITTDATSPAGATNPASATRFQQRPRTPYRSKGDYSRDDKEGGDQGSRHPKFKKKICRFCYDSNIKIDYKDFNMLERFITDRGKILPRRVTGTCSKHQRLIAVAIKRARIIALIPFVEK